MFSRLLVGIDSSAGATAALTAAIDLGRRFHSTIVLAAITDIQVLEAPLLASAPLWTEGLPPLPADQSLGPVMRERAERLVEAASQRVRDAGLAVETVFATGIVEEELLHLAEQSEALVVGRRGEMHTDPGTLGATTVKLVRRSPKPVLIAGESPSPCQRPVVAYDGGETSSSALALASRYCGAVGVALIVVHVGSDAAAAAALLARAEAFCSSQQVACEAHWLQGDVARAIATHVERTGADLIVAGAHGGRRRSWSIGSHAEQLLRTTSVPVIIVR